MIPAALAEHDAPETTTEWGVFSYSKGLKRYVLDECDDHEQAEAMRDHLRRRVSASALLVHREVITGRWTPETAGGAV
ncbi:hypothetical protein [Streptomyces sp.]|uniref:hypothetical protein n=1 Tax=Streptomyces sp. TaxID=1931 RepID=UPI002F93A826